MKNYKKILFSGFLLAVFCLKAYSDANPLVIWTQSPWLPSRGSDRPDSDRSLTCLEVEAGQNEYESAVLVLSNMTDEEVSVQLSGVETIPGLQSMRRLEPDHQAIVDLGFDISGFNDPLEVGGPLLEWETDPVSLNVPARSSSLLWLTFHTGDLEPGAYAAPLSFRAGDEIVCEVEVRLTVWDFRLTDQAELGVGCYNFQHTEADVQEVANYKVNTMFIADCDNDRLFHLEGGTYRFAPRNMNTYEITARHGLRAGWAFGLCRNFYTWAQANGIAYGTETFDAYWKETVQRVDRILKDFGLGYDEYSMCVWDEAGLRGEEEVLQATHMVKIAKETVPGIRWVNTVCVTPGEAIEKLAAYLSIIVFTAPGWSENEYFTRLKAENPRLEYWHYACRTPVRGQPPFSYFRYFGWRAVRHKMDGIAFFAYENMVYRRDGRVWSARPWEAYREGIEDWQYVHLGRTLADELLREYPGDESISALAAAFEAEVSAVIEESGGWGFPADTQEMSDKLYAHRRMMARLLVQMKQLKDR